MIDKKILTPKFLTKEVAQFAVEQALLVIRSMAGILNRQMCHIIVLVPSRDDSGEYPNYPIEPYVLYEYSLGDDMTAWNKNYVDIAQCKALQLWQDRNDDRTDCMPHLLFPGDTPFWGGVKRHGIVVACSGFQPHFDKMVAGMVADVCIALSYNGTVAN